MKTLKKYHGVVVPMVTPVSKDGSIDTVAVERIVDNMARYGVAPLIMGTTGEGNSVSTEGGVQMIAAAKKAAQGRVTIYTGLAGNCISEQLAAAERFIEAGADVIRDCRYPALLLCADSRADGELLSDAGQCHQGAPDALQYHHHHPHEHSTRRD